MTISLTIFFFYPIFPYMNNTVIRVHFQDLNVHINTKTHITLMHTRIHSYMYM